MKKQIPRQTYEEYLETMKAYRFSPISRELWQNWEDYYLALRGEQP